MKRTIFFLVFGMLVLNAQAKIWRVNNSPSVSADFSDLQVAMDGVNAGDTLYVEGSVTAYTSANDNFYVSKQQVIIGPGYLLNDNDSTLFNKSSATIGSQFSIKPTALGTQLKGLVLNSFLWIGASNVTIQRCIVANIQLGIYNTNNTNTKSNIINPTIIQCLFQVLGAGGGWGTIGNNGLVSNNIIETGISVDTGSLFILNNTIGKGLGGNNANSLYTLNCTIQNNLIRGSIYEGAMSGATYISANNTLSNNLTSTDNMFVGGTLRDKKHVLSTTSSAKGAGTGGVDCGAFGGSDPYVLSGLPAIPHIYVVVAPTSGSVTSGLVVKVKVKTQK